MKYCRLLLLVPVFSLPVFSQPSPRNLDFEQKGNSFNPIAPWVRNYFSRPMYRIVLDSTVYHNGHYSLRVTYDTISKDISAGGVYNQLALDVIGKKLRFSAYIKQSNPDDTAGSFSCVVSQDMGERKTSARGRPIIHAKDWTLFTREMDLDSFNLPIHHLRLNLNFKTRDTVWIDDLKLELDGKDIYSSPSFASAKNEFLRQLSTHEVFNLQTLCRVWGFLKYFHPQVAAGKYNWDMELFKLIPLVRSAKDNGALSQVLLSWIDSLGEIPNCLTCYIKIPDDVITYNLDLEWMKSISLSPALRDKLDSILLNRHTGNGYYARYLSVNNLDFINENDYGDWRDIGYPNELFRLQLLFRYWNTIQYFYPYKNIIGKDWNKVLTDFIPRFSVAPDFVTYHIAMAELVNSVNDSHSGIWDQPLRKELVPFYFPANTTFINNEEVITGFPNDSLAKANGLQLGDVIEKIDGLTISEIINRFDAITNGSNRAVKLAYMNGNNYITAGKDSVARVMIRRKDQHLPIQVNRYRSIPDRSLKDNNHWKILAGNTGFVNMGLLQRKEVDSMFRQLKDTRAIIFDLRHYPNSTVTNICNYIYSEPKQFVKTLCPNLDYPGTFIWKGRILYGPTPDTRNAFHYTGKVIILVNENTQSQAEWTTMAFQAVPGAVTIGSQTAGADGDVSYLYLAGNALTKMTGIGVFYPDGTATQRTGIRIDITVYPTVKGIREGRDEVLEKALAEAAK